jgi:hypothetical protein
MLKIFNNKCIILLSLFISYCIVKKINNLNKPFDEFKFIEQYQNQKKIKKKITLENFPKELSNLASYYVGLN